MPRGLEEDPRAMKQIFFFLVASRYDCRAAELRHTQQRFRIELVAFIRVPSRSLVYVTRIAKRNEVRVDQSRVCAVEGSLISRICKGILCTAVCC